MTGLTVFLNAWLGVAVLSLGPGAFATTSQASAQTAAVSEGQVQEAVAAIAQPKDFNDLLVVLDRYKSVIGSREASALVAQRVREAGADQDARRLLTVMGQLFTDTTKETTETAAERYLVRLIAVSAMTTADTDRLQRLLMRYYDFSPKMTPALIKPALETLRLDWPAALPGLMGTFVEDWHTMGAREAGRELADSLDEVAHDPTGEIARTRDVSLVGQWYFTHKGTAAEPEDINLVLTKHGTARTYASTGGPEDFEGITAGRWVSKGGILTITWESGEELSAPETTSAHYEVSNGELAWAALGATSWRRR
jgi:hypothetical protein